MVDQGADDPRIGRCTRCAHARVQESARGSQFWRCGRADVDPSFLRYPPLPVQVCDGFERADTPLGIREP